MTTLKTRYHHTQYKCPTQIRLPNKRYRHFIIGAVCSLFCHLAGSTDIASEPVNLALPAKPNLMMLLDDSGSMLYMYTPDYVAVGIADAAEYKHCLGSAEQGLQTRQGCWVGDPPVMSPDFNTQYYNPEIRYLPAVNSDGTSKPSMTSANTNNWKAVSTDGVSINDDTRKTMQDGFQGGGQITQTQDLVTGFPDRAWCNNANTNANTPSGSTNCRFNGKQSNGEPSQYNYPNGSYGYGNYNGAKQYGYGSAYYYRIQVTEYCADVALKECKTATSPTSVGGVVYSYAARVRFCTDSSRSSCQGTRTKENYFPNFLKPNPIASETFIAGNVFTRTNIVPGNTYTRYPDRSDCASPTSCTYDEEMTNFANWFAYHRTRSTMAKTVLGHTFYGLDSNTRIGFATFNFDPSRFLGASEFTSAQKSSWFDKLYRVGNNGGTNTREALARIGHYYANINTVYTGMPSSPIQLSCQQNFTLLATDGYWGDGVKTPTGKSLSGADIGNTDGTNNGYSTRADAAYDANASSGSLADMAMYFFANDLRPDLTNNVPAWKGVDATHQHMNLFAIGIGTAGTLNFPSDLSNIISGAKNWPNPFTSTDQATHIDDLWHATINARGQYYRANDVSSLNSNLIQALQGITTQAGAGGGVGVAGNVLLDSQQILFSTKFQTGDWTGDLSAYRIDPNDGSVSSTAVWSAANELLKQTYLTRKIYTFDSGDAAGNKLRSFCWSGAKSQQQYTDVCSDGNGLISSDFGSPSHSVSSLDQSKTWPSGDVRINLDSTIFLSRLIDYLRGDRTHEISGAGTAATDLFRRRTGLLGDIVNAQPVYVKAPLFGYNSGSNTGKDPYYQAYVTANTDRIPTVYVAANDGMLHAFRVQAEGTALAGSERWAYVPQLLLPNLVKLANSPYTHLYTVDGTPTVGDVCFGHTNTIPCSQSSQWRTILVAGLNAGSRGYYALDITDPNNPKGLWEFGVSATCLTDNDANPSSPDAATGSSDCHVGLSFGNPIITKRASDGRWVVIVSSGYNNDKRGDGRGYIYVLDAQTGKILNRFTTNVGTKSDPSGLARISAWAANGFYDNTSLSVYGGDLKGNVWRVDLNQAKPSTYIATKIISLVDPSGLAQPISTRPELGEVNGQRMLYIGTGKNLSASDLADTQKQTIYGIRDDLVNSTTITYARNSANSQLVQQYLVAMNAGSNRTVCGGTSVATGSACPTPNSVDLKTKYGWFIDLPNGGQAGVNGSERIGGDPQLQLGSLVFASSIPAALVTCGSGGYGWVNYVDFATGGFISSPDNLSNISSERIRSGSPTGANVVQVADGQLRANVAISTAAMQSVTVPTVPSVLSGRRIGWRELILY